MGGLQCWAQLGLAIKHIMRYSSSDADPFADVPLKSLPRRLTGFRTHLLLEQQEHQHNSSQAAKDTVDTKKKADENAKKKAQADKKKGAKDTKRTGKDRDDDFVFVNLRIDSDCVIV
ncbi:unnamed protein product [Bursaphelenchus okinawaensis]|uniref:Uncharacterized protein n=1 Tax=Bursaphelenchus okinawaensis TaxID=465554 RepID=A0A811KS32_9BILA|nr:unnamed protein product [Bursaphelenchus okinawaensis]CAG9110821.1 unnamed protein product [Bursaphelenchus okinawaensis]